MSAMFSPSKMSASSPHSFSGTSTLGSSNTSKRRIERRTSKIRDLEEHLRKGGVSFPFGAARAIVDNDYESIEDVLRLNEEQLVQLLVMAGVKHKSIVTFTHYCSGLRSNKSMENMDDTSHSASSHAQSTRYNETAYFDTPNKSTSPLMRMSSPNRNTHYTASSLHEMSGEMSQRRGDDKPGRTFYDMEKKYGVTAPPAMVDELPFDGFSEVTNALNVLMLQAKKSYDEAEDEYRSALR
jgi:hypothetical protein